MIIAFTTQGQTLDSPLDPRFGRAQGFLVYDTDSGETRYATNEQNMSLAQGAGIQAAMNLVKTGAKAIVTGHVGPKAFAALAKGKVDIYLCELPTVAQALEAFQQNRLQPAQDADRPGHW